MHFEFNCIFFTLSFLGVICNCIAICLLTIIKKRGIETVNLIYLFNLSIVSIILAVFSTTNMILVNVFIHTETIRRISTLLFIINTMLILVVYLLLKVLIVIDKLLEIKCNITYPVFWNERKTKLTVRVIWTVGIVIILTIAIVYFFGNFSYNKFYSFYIVVPVSSFYVLFAIVSNAYIFFKFNKARLHPCVRSKNHKIAKGFWSVFMKSRFFIPVLLTLIFVLFHLVPILISTRMRREVIDKRNEPVINSFGMYLRISFVISHFADAICIFLEGNVKRLIRKKIRERRGRVGTTNCITTTIGSSARPFSINTMSKTLSTHVRESSIAAPFYANTRINNLFDSVTKDARSNNQILLE